MAIPSTEPSHRPSSFSPWLDELLHSWLLPGVAGAALAVTGALFLLDIASPVFTAALIAAVVTVGVFLVMVRPAVAPGGDPRGRALLVGAGAATLVFTAVPALQAILPGTALFQGDVGVEGEGIAVPPGVSGRIRLLVSGRLNPGGDPSISFRLTGTEQPIEGKLERTIGYARVGRSGRTQVAHDHNSDWYEGRIPAGATELKLAERRGQPDGRLQISVYRDWLPGALVWIAAFCALALAAVADARLGTKGNTAVAAGMSLAFGLLVAFNATPGSPLGPVLGGVVLGAMMGSIVGALAGWLVRKMVPAAGRRGPSRPDRRNGAAED
jgi:hypothetical protein